jgi:hypothetical protein
MQKLLMIALTAVLAGSALGVSAFGEEKAKVDRDRPTVNQLVAYDEARIARLKAELRLTKEQESGWAKVEGALRDIAKRRAERTLARMDEREKSDRPPTPAARLRLEADSMTQGAADLKRIADAVDPIYDKFDDRQKRAVTAMMRAQSMDAWQGVDFGESPRRRGRRGDFY